MTHSIAIPAPKKGETYIMLVMAGIFQRNGKWYCRQRINGRLVMWSLAKHGVNTEAQARKYLAEYQKSALADKLAELDPGIINLKQFQAEYISHREKLNLSRETIIKDKYAFNSIMDVLGEKFLLRSLTNRKIGEWAAVKLASGVKPASINSYLRHIRAALNTAVEWGGN